MPDTKISGLAQVTAFATTLEFPVNDSGVSHKITGTQLAAAFPQGTLSGGYAQVTAAQSPITVLVAVTGVTVTVTVGAGRRIKVTTFVPMVSTTATDTLGVAIYEGANQLAIQWIALSATGGSGFGSPLATVLTPSAGAHTYFAQCLRVAGAGTVSTGAGITNPAWILAEDIGV